MSEPAPNDSATDRHVTGVFDDLLKQPVAILGRVRTDGALRHIGVLAAGALLAFLLCGLVAGSFQGGAQMAVAAWKAPLIVVLSALLCAPVSTSSPRCSGRH